MRASLGAGLRLRSILGSVVLVALAAGGCSSGSATTLDLPEPKDDQEYAEQVVLKKYDFPETFIRLPEGRSGEKAGQDPLDKSVEACFPLEPTGAAKSGLYKEDRALLEASVKVYETAKDAALVYGAIEDETVLNCLVKAVEKYPPGGLARNVPHETTGEVLELKGAGDESLQYRITIDLPNLDLLWDVAVVRRGRLIVDLFHAATVKFPADFRNKLLVRMLDRIDR